MKGKLDIKDFMKRLKSMLKVDFRRMFTMPLVYIMASVSLVIPILILVMTTMTGGMTMVDPNTGIETTMEGFTNVWQAIGSVSGVQMGMDIAGMCNINLLYFLIAVFVCIFVSEDFRSGYVKNLFTVRAKRMDYCVSKTTVCIAGGVIMIFMYFVGAMIGGKIAGLSFDTIGFGAGGIVACLFSKIFLVAIFVSLALLLSVVGKQKLWISILGSIGACALLFTMLPMISPLNSNMLNVIMTLAGGALFSVGLGAVSNLILNKTSLV